MAIDQFRFFVSDGLHSTQAYTFRIDVLIDETSDLSLQVGITPQIKASGNITLDSMLLSANDDHNNPVNIVYQLMRVPVYGSLWLSSKMLSHNATFTQLDLMSGNIVYKHTRFRKEVSYDAFEFRVFNDVYEKTGRFYIEIIPPPNKPPVIDDIAPVMVAQNGTAVFTNRNLNASDEDGDPNMITYIISKHPEYGFLLRSKKLINSDTFTQQEINDRLISYRRRDGALSGSDHFLFKISDGTAIGHLKVGKIKAMTTMR